jgi:hypothetical protein
LVTNSGTTDDDGTSSPSPTASASATLRKFYCNQNITEQVERIGMMMMQRRGECTSAGRAAICRAVSRIIDTNSLLGGRTTARLSSHSILNCNKARACLPFTMADKSRNELCHVMPTDDGSDERNKKC